MNVAAVWIFTFSPRYDAERKIRYDSLLENRMADRDVGGRVSKALELENITATKAVEEINEECRKAEKAAINEFSQRGILQSGSFAVKFSEIHCDKAKRIVDKKIALRRKTLEVVPEIATNERFPAAASFQTSIRRVN